MLCAVLLQENAGGVSRDEMAAVLMEVVDGRLPKDRIALRELYNEIIGWPWLEAEEDQTEGTGEAVADYEGITPTGIPVGASNMDWCLPGHSDLLLYAHAKADAHACLHRELPCLSADFAYPIL